MKQNPASGRGGLRNPTNRRGKPHDFGWLPLASSYDKDDRHQREGEMRRGLLVLLGTLALAVGTAIAIWFMRIPASSVDWLRARYGLDARQTADLSQMQSEYQARSIMMCARISTAEQRLAEAIWNNNTVTPELGKAIAESDRVRTECRISMLAHFYDVASMLPKERQADYIEMVLPVVLRPEEMVLPH